MNLILVLNIVEGTLVVFSSSLTRRVKAIHFGFRKIKKKKVENLNYSAALECPEGGAGVGRRNKFLIRKKGFCGKNGETKEF